MALQMLDVAIGMIFVFLLLSLICTALNEIIESWLKMRSKNLEKGIQELLKDPGGSGLVSKLYNHPLINNLFKGNFPDEGKHLPSYIPARNFALALIDIFANDTNEGNPKPETGGSTEVNIANLSYNDLIKRISESSENPEIRKAILILLITANGKIDKAIENIEEWYNSSMDRVSGWYKRRVQYILLVMGFIIAIATNADAIAIFKSLVNDPPVRESLVVAAQSYAQPQSETSATQTIPPEERIKNNIKQLQQYSLPIGWHWKSKLNNSNEAVTNFSAVPPAGWGWVFKVIGWIVTALAISLGAPFWFDVLNKFMVVRSTVKPKEKSPEEGSEDRGKK